MKPPAKAAPPRAVGPGVPGTRPSRTVYAFGFDRLGFSALGQEEVVVDDVRIALLPFADTRRLDEADGLIVPSGIFDSEVWERLKNIPRYFVRSTPPVAGKSSGQVFGSPVFVVLPNAPATPE